MIQAVTTLRVKAGQVDEFLKIAELLVKVGQANPGNIFFHLAQNVDDEAELIFLENWKSQDAIDVHKATKEFAEICPVLADMCERDMDCKVYETDL